MKLTAFGISGVFAGVGGTIMALFVSGTYPELANWTMSGEAIFMVMLGGISTFLGPCRRWCGASARSVPSRAFDLIEGFVSRLRDADIDELLDSFVMLAPRRAAA